LRQSLLPNAWAQASKLVCTNSPCSE